MTYMKYVSVLVVIVPGRNTTLVVNVTEGEDLTVNCSIETNTPSWSRRDGEVVQTKTRIIDGVLLRIENVSIADTGVYECRNGKDQHTIWIQVLVKLEVEMELVVENYVFTEELKNKSSPVYKETEKNFTTEMDNVHRGVTPGYVRTDVLGFKKGSVKVDFKIVIVLVTNDPENATDLPDVKAEAAQRVVVRAKTGVVERLKVKQVIVKTVPLEPGNVEIFGIDSDELSVRWNPSEDADSFQIQKYVVQHRKFEEKLYTNTSQPASDDKTQYTIRIQPLEPETTYMIRVGAVNQYGDNFNDETAHKTDVTPFAWWIIVVVVLVILLVLVILVVLIVYKRKKDRKREVQQQGSRFDALELESPTHEVAGYESKNVKGLVYSYSNDAYKPSEVSWDEIPYKDLKLLDELGSGAFGVVYKGEYLQESGNVLPCAVKSLKPSASREEVRDLYNELEIMGNVGYHPNLVNLIGACTEDGHLLVVLEIAENGSLIEFLKKSRQTDQSYEIVKSGLTEEMKTGIATDVARGMAHLAKCRCIHRDLAARNVLLGKDYVAKVSDYGMARDVYEELMYKKETQGKLPVKWMAIESLQTYIFTIESDVWSYGVLLWEIESGGLKPYAGLSTQELIAELKKGYRLEKPDGCSEEMYQVMRSCWNPNPSARPTFDQLRIQLESKIVT
ncbi:angiopoietin-1 receptor-like [Orbicella faveolata]|uniref:angiopoietin-1 receptor-like n=1 Tax=Orbicella faveolata TaxID=48498 RepID=UPI0009E4B002|nr:angiopoietin-1 receptor-like [Orbicella faveolata]